MLLNSFNIDSTSFQLAKVGGGGGGANGFKITAQQMLKWFTRTLKENSTAMFFFFCLQNLAKNR